MGSAGSLICGRLLQGVAAAQTSCSAWYYSESWEGTLCVCARLCFVVAFF